MKVYLMDNGDQVPESKVLDIRDGVAKYRKYSKGRIPMLTFARITDSVFVKNA